MPSKSKLTMGSSADSLFPEIGSKLTKIINVYNQKTNRLDPKTLFRKLKSSEVGENPKVNLIGTVKLHGSHADIVIDYNDAIRFRSRRQAEITLDNDVSGVVERLLPLRTPILILRNRILMRWMEFNPGVEVMKLKEYPVVIAGEWVGPGIFNTVALNDLSRRVFVIILISVNNEWLNDGIYADIYDNANDIYHIGQVGHAIIELAIDEPEEAERAMMEQTMRVEKQCPFANGLFGIKGVGEGIVWKMEHPLGADPKCWVKTKGPLHAETNAAKLEAMVKAGTGVDAKFKAQHFAEIVCTNVRMEKVMMTTHQMCKGKREFGPGETGHFMQLLNKDILKEEMQEIEKQQVNVALLGKEVDGIAKKWFHARMEKLMIAPSLVLPKAPSVISFGNGRRLGGRGRRLGEK